MSTLEIGQTRYEAHVTRTTRLPDGTYQVVDLMSFGDAPAWELAPAMKALAKKIHESPPPVVLEGQEPMPWS